MTRPTTRLPEKKSNRENRYAGREDSKVQSFSRNYKVTLPASNLQGSALIAQLEERKTEATCRFISG